MPNEAACPAEGAFYCDGKLTRSRHLDLVCDCTTRFAVRRAQDRFHRCYKHRKINNLR